MISSKKGFTLLELVVVVAIIGILASIALIPNLLRFQQRGAASAIKSQTGQISSAFELAGVEGCIDVHGSVGGEMFCDSDGDVAGAGGASEAGETVFIKTMPRQPVSGAQFDFDGTCGAPLGTSFGNINPTTGGPTICATGFLDAGVFTCTSGSCACDNVALCQR